MPWVSERQKLLDALSTAKQELELAVYLKILCDAVFEAESSSSLHTDSSSAVPSPLNLESSKSDMDDGSGSVLSGPLDLPMIGLLSAHGMVEALEDEVKQAHVLQSRPPSIQIPQLALLDEW